MAEGVIGIVSKYKGAQWAGNSLRDWGKNVIFGEVPPNARLIILDASQEGIYRHVNCDKIILKDVEMSSQHILAQSGVLVTFGQQKQFLFPNFIVELVVSNGLSILVFQMLLEAKKEGSSIKQKSHYVSIVTLIKYFGAFNISAKEIGMITKPRSYNVLEGGAPYYSVYKCREGSIAVGNLEPKFYAEMIRGLDLSAEQKIFCEDGQFSEDTDKLRSILTRKFMEKPAKEWENHFSSYDTCITQIKSPYVDKVREPKLVDLRPKL